MATTVQLLRDIPRSRAEWIVWVDMDIIIDKMDFQLPLSTYEGKDFVVWGREDKILEGDVLNGMLSAQHSNSYKPSLLSR